MDRWELFVAYIGVIFDLLIRYAVIFNMNNAIFNLIPLKTSYIFIKIGKSPVYKYL